MSVDRQDCEHGHGRLVNELAAMIASDHGLTMKGAVLVILPALDDADGLEWEGRVFGFFNTAGLAQAADAVLAIGSDHIPDGCKTCDSAGKAMSHARQFFRDQYHFLVEGRRRGPHEAFDAYARDPEIRRALDRAGELGRLIAADAFARGAAWALAEQANRKAKS